MTTILNFVLATIVIIGVICGYLAIHRMGEEPGMMMISNQLNLKVAKVQSLANDVTLYNQTAKDPELSRMLQTLMAKPAAAK